MRPTSLFLVVASISAGCSALSATNGGDQMAIPAFASPDQARPLSANHINTIEDTRYLRARPDNHEDEDRDLSILNKITKELLDEILPKTIEAQSNFFAFWKESGLPVKLVAQRIQELTPQDEKYLTIAFLYSQFQKGEQLSAIYKQNPLRDFGESYPTWRAWVMSLLKE
ncbi:hypothetical protein JG688_00014471 [Phytophthora aleatoria]|uniref:RxLR effector protein n=1 Tax=Phytophthora aleatoria TaxID=2496075 RepID=A0A8J5IL44_9STRA|nr:hypothetical protein JG688_00014471 [Phytophthora aleatoria]